MTKRVERGCSESELAKWLVSAMESHMPSQQIQAMLVSRFGLRDDEAVTAQRRAYGGISRAISGSRKCMPSAETDPIGFAAFNLVWDTLNQNSFFDRRHTPSRKWLDWKAQEKYQYPD